MNSRVRAARLRGIKEANRLLKMFEARERLEDTDGQVDVLGTLAHLDVVVLFRPLDGLLGAYLRGDQPGVLISTKRQPSVQRFTAAHELGHAILNHEPSLDSPDVLRRAAMGVYTSGSGGFSASLQEIEADAFAGEFLMPLWLITYHCKRQGWSTTQLEAPETAYQLALRCGSSYEATIRNLERNHLISSAAAGNALRIKPKAIKRDAGHDGSLTSSWADVWRISEADAAHRIPVTAGDLINVHLNQEASAGYIWRRTAEIDECLTLIEEWTAVSPEAVGEQSLKSYLLRAEHSGQATVSMTHGRPWEQEGSVLEFMFRASDREEGLSRANKRRMIVD